MSSGVDVLDDQRQRTQPHSPNQASVADQPVAITTGPCAEYDCAVNDHARDPRHVVPAQRPQPVAGSSSNSATPVIETHWSRIFHCDLFNADTGRSTPDLRENIEGDVWPAGYGLHPAARARRSFELGQTLIAMVQAASASARRAHARFQQRRTAKAIYNSLRRLDDRTLLDLGIDRSEITSVAAEFAGQAESTRVRALERKNETAAVRP